MKNNISIIIPARLKSSRFPNKVLKKIYNIPIIEHVRRRALLVKNIDNVYIATSDKQIIKTIKDYKGKILKTKGKHFNGTSRAAEATKQISSKYIIILQADEPLIIPDEIDIFAKYIKKTKYNYYNCIGKINHNELDDQSIVKCQINKNIITNCYRKIIIKKVNNESPKVNFKLFGLLGFERKSLLKLINNKRTLNEKKLKIEQMRIIDNNYKLRPYLIKGTKTSVNYKKDMKIAIDEIKNNNIQNKIFKKIYYESK